MERAKNYNTFALFPPVQNKRNCSLDKNNCRQFGDGFAVHLRRRYNLVWYRSQESLQKIRCSSFHASLRSMLRNIIEQPPGDKTHRKIK